MKVAKDNNLLFCSSLDCGNVLKKSDAVESKLNCGKCGGNTCIKCKLPYHAFSKCDSKEQRMFEEWAQGLNIHKCPRCGC
jgi:hypothetical protein